MGFLGGCLNGSATDTVELAAGIGGFNAWRLAMQDIRGRKNTTRAQTRRAVRNLLPVQGVAHIGHAANDCDAIHKAYTDAGCTIHDGQEKGNDLPGSIPEESRHQFQ